ncbi:hypothetical protein [Leptothoe sp. PORK10 BA2]|uniref:hypothetical protein n=1 Tax=Leptothoe sp. PORK10 BA2 TaxID=3110254 RepID=UPI002B21A5B3|nr:hypothetical protein [Leptothoe sp. PORK10 BA2]MEA5466623.1 hypothetical protein [Leptothoe sp. PORK10 BA2]
MNPDVEKTASLIPEFYFDLLARILPGLLFYACVDYAWWGTLHKPGTLLESFFVVAVCYVLGLIMDLVGDLILNKFEIRNAVIIVLNKLPQVKNPQVVNLLVKMCAEVILLRSLWLTSSIFFVFSVLTHIFKTLPQHLSGLTALIFLLLVLLFVVFRYFQEVVEERLRINSD